MAGEENNTVDISKKKKKKKNKNKNKKNNTPSREAGLPRLWVNIDPKERFFSI